jgi:GntR family transcriptional repressor for pyruvate dehydrogenase complex
MLEDPTVIKFESTELTDDRLEIQVYRDLLDKIRFGTFKIGQKLPSENDLCAEHKVSRPVVRAALSKLRVSGLIISRKGSGSYVNSGIPNDQVSFTQLVSIEDISSYFEYRRVIEAAAATYAAENASYAEIRVLTSAADEVKKNLLKGEDAINADINFHTTLANLSNNRFFKETIELLTPQWNFVGHFLRSLKVSGDRRGMRMVSEHDLIVDAIAKNNPDAARTAMLEHIDGSERRVFKGK